MRRLNFLDDEPWDEENDGINRTRWFGHAFEADKLRCLMHASRKMLYYFPR